MIRWSIFHRSVSRRLVGAMVVVALGGLSVMGEEKPSEKNLEVGITKPADEKPVELRFKGAGLIKSVAVKKGDAVKADQVLMAQDDIDEQAELEIRKKDATDIRIKAAEVSADAKWAEFKRVKNIHDADGKNDAEFEKAQAEAKLADLNIVQEKQDLEVKKAKVEQQQKIVNRMTLHSPTDGIVQAVEAHVGEMVDPSKPAVVTIVNNNPLIVEVNLPTAQSLKLKIDQPMRVSYDRKNWKEARVSYLAPMADAASGMQTINLKLPNPENQVSGLQIYVELPDTLVAAK